MSYKNVAIGQKNAVETITIAALKKTLLLF